MKEARESLESNFWMYQSMRPRRSSTRLQFLRARRRSSRLVPPGDLNTNWAALARRLGMGDHDLFASVVSLRQDFDESASKVSACPRLNQWPGYTHSHSNGNTLFPGIWPILKYCRQ